MGSFLSFRRTPVEVKAGTGNLLWQWRLIAGFCPLHSVFLTPLYRVRGDV